MADIGLFGGTFDPPHCVHYQMAQSFADQLNLHEVIWIPSGDPYHKTVTTRTHAHHRFQMCTLATRNNARFAVSDVDVARQGVTYTFDTVRIFQQIFAGDTLWWLLGSDSLHQLNTWYRFKDLCRLIRFAVIARDSALQMPEWTQHTKAQIHVIHQTPSSLSSTQIRQKIKENQSVDGLINPDVLDYIHQHHLY